MNKILIVEDDAVSRRFLNKFLNRYGECDMVVDGLEAMDAYMMALQDNAPYDLICLDIMMPKIDGVKVLKAIRDLEAQKRCAAHRRAKIVMITALGETQLVQTAYDYGCDAYLSKPVSTDRLQDLLEQIGFDRGTGC